MTEFQQTVDDLLNEYWQYNPVEATHVGVHRYDDQLPERGPDVALAWGETLRDFKSRFEAFDAASLPHEEALDRRWALAVLTKLRIDHERRFWERAPKLYLDWIGTGLHDLLLSEPTQDEKRFRALLTRLRAVPRFLEAAKENIDPEAVPPIWIDSSLRVASDVEQFLRGGILDAAERVPSLEDDIIAAAEAADDAVAAFEGFVRSIEDRADGDFAAGPERFDRLLQKYHMLNMDGNELYEFGRERIDRYERKMDELAEQIDPNSSWVDVLDSVKDDHPTSENLRRAYEDETMLARDHCLEHDLISFPVGETVDIEWMPEFMRDAYPIAKPWVSPPFEDGLSGKWYITPVDTEASAEEQEQHLRDNSWAWIRGIAQHEMYPGHHLHLAIHKQIASPLRLQFTSPVYLEGWGLYTEELFYETGLLDEPALRLMQLRNSLWRAVRIVIDTGLHTRGMTPEEAIELLVDRARLEPRWAESEVQRYTMRPTYPSSYLVGLSQLIDIREKYRMETGNEFSLRDFHDALMDYSALPLSMVEEELL
ncbi:DUF885 domain-containing protein [Natronosalvus halobius]|uniref:DUF885 domain-containing protein n=1 Tax=Natronosalvus halobius TaxID=2953746 RepID=UPI0020A067BF|nr:DUF885 domain-containing protein [Natronosalvus halobius]USZ73696.1 DUF885 domain-containing protein [Natronosalvus halobius]